MGSYANSLAPYGGGGEKAATPGGIWWPAVGGDAYLVAPLLRRRRRKVIAAATRPTKAMAPTAMPTPAPVERPPRVVVFWVMVSRVLGASVGFSWRVEELVLVEEPELAEEAVLAGAFVEVMIWVTMMVEGMVTSVLVRVWLKRTPQSSSEVPWRKS